MIWTKFKDEIPRKDIIYVTDWYSVWTLDAFPRCAIGEDWSPYAKDNPEYAWADIPIPQVPEEPGDFHKCQSGSWICEGPIDGSFIYGFEDMSVSSVVNFCPFCGKEAKRR